LDKVSPALTIRKSEKWVLTVRSFAGFAGNARQVTGRFAGIAKKIGFE